MNDISYQHLENDHKYSLAGGIYTQEELVEVHDRLHAEKNVFNHFHVSDYTIYKKWNRIERAQVFLDDLTKADE